MAQQAAGEQPLPVQLHVYVRSEAEEAATVAQLQALPVGKARPATCIACGHRMQFEPMQRVTDSPAQDLPPGVQFCPGSGSVFDGALYMTHLAPDTLVGSPLLATPEIGSTQVSARNEQLANAFGNHAMLFNHGRTRKFS
jgi:hypothetical protein